LARGEHAEVVESEHDNIDWPTLRHHLKPPVSLPWTAASVRGLQAFTAEPASAPPPRFMTESPISGWLTSSPTLAESSDRQPPSTTTPMRDTWRAAPTGLVSRCLGSSATDASK